MAKHEELSPGHWIIKSNVLNEIRNSHMSISQIRFFSVYLSKINPRDIKSREVILKLNEYTRIMQFKQINTTRLSHTADELLGLTVTFWDKTGQYSKDGMEGFIKCQIFKRFRLFRNNENEWLVSIDCHDDVLKLMFELQGYYFKYQLWNAMQLTSVNQQRMYEILKQYEYAGVREISVKDLREFLGIKTDEYPQWERFRTRVLDASKEALANYTDIKFTWEVAERGGRGGKIKKLKFNIEKNKDYIRRTKNASVLLGVPVDEYLEQKEMGFEKEPEEFERLETELDESVEPRIFEDEIYSFLKEACENEFNQAEIQVLYNLAIQIVPRKGSREEFLLEMYNYFKRKYDELQWRAAMTKISSRMGYIKKIIEADVSAG